MRPGSALSAPAHGRGHPQGAGGGRRGSGRANWWFTTRTPAPAGDGKLGVEVAVDNAEVMHAPVVVLAVKPRLWTGCWKEIREYARPCHLVISIAAGVPRTVGRGPAPEPGDPRHAQYPAMVRAGMTALALGGRATPRTSTWPWTSFGPWAGPKWWWRTRHGRSHRTERQRSGLCGGVPGGFGRRRRQDGPHPYLAVEFASQTVLARPASSWRGHCTRVS